MNILYLTMGRLDDVNESGINTDLLRCLRDHGHNVFVVCTNERRKKKPTAFTIESEINVLRVKIGNITKCNIIEKGISTLGVKRRFVNAIKKFIPSVKFDLIIYTTPPITFFGAVNIIKKRDNAKTFLLLKDIFPQNAVDISVLKKSGLKGTLYKYFRHQEKQLYSISDYIGCMSPANVKYVLANNTELDPSKVGVCPNSINILDNTSIKFKKNSIREKYGIPIDKKVFVYGGNLGKPQDISYIIECLKMQNDNKNAFFLIVGDGTDFEKLKSFFEEEKRDNMRLFKALPKDDYNVLISSCDVGLIFLDHRFTIPNFPSRLLGYMQAGLPVLACTDVNSDIGTTITEGGFGWWCESNNSEEFSRLVDEICDLDEIDFEETAKEYLVNCFSIEKQYQIIMNTLDEGEFTGV